MPLRADRRPATRSPESQIPAAQSPAQITAIIQAFLDQHPNSLLLEEGRTLFDLGDAQYALTAEQDRATLHLWSADRNLVRRVLAVTPRSKTLRLTTQRFGQARPQTLDLSPDKSLRAPTSRHTSRQHYLRLLERVLLRAFPDDQANPFRSAMDLERSFGPGYARGTLTRGQQAWAVIAVNASESQATIDGILTIGILWLQHCRDHAASASSRKARLYGGLRLILPRGTASTTLSRLAWLNPRLGRYELFELDEQTEELSQRDPSDHGNLTTRLIHAPDVAAALERFAEAIPQVLALLPSGTQIFGLDPGQAPPPPLPPPANASTDPSEKPSPQPGHSQSANSQSGNQEPRNSQPPHQDPQNLPSENVPSQNLPSPNLRSRNDGWLAATHRVQPGAAHRNANPVPGAPTCELRLRSSTELAFLLHGLEFARIRSSFVGQSFNRQLQVTVGSGPSETPLLAGTRTHLRELVRHLFDRRRSVSSASEAPFPNPTQDILFRTQPERWLESTLRANLTALDPELEPSPVYTQVPAFTGAGSNLDRGMLDLLAVTRNHRLAVIELKTDEDLHLALQGLDYWIRVRHHHLANPEAGAAPLSGIGDLQQHGYFPHTRLSPEPPHLYLVAPALHIHPATETILRHLSPRVPWTLIALDERWRTHIKPIWRKCHTGQSSEPSTSPLPLD